MAYCGFSDSSSDDDDEHQDIDIKQNSSNHHNSHTAASTNGAKHNNNGKDQPEGHDEEADVWMQSKVKPSLQEIEEQKKEERKAKRKAKYTFNNYLAPTSLKDMESDIHSSTTNADTSSLPPPPPPLQDLNDCTEIAYNRSQGTYRMQRSHRPNLDTTEYVPPSKHPWSIPPTITGVSAQAQIGRTNKEQFEPAKIKLREVVYQLKNAEFRPEEFVAVRVKLKNPSMTVTIFSNGTLTTQGGKSQYSCMVALRKVARMLQKLEEYKEKIREMNAFSFHGIQSNAHLGCRVNLQSMSEAFPKKVEYSPDIESAYLKFRDPLKYGDKGSCHVYHGGRVTILGCRSVVQTIQWLDDMYLNCKPHFLSEEMMNGKDSVSNQDFSKMFESENYGEKQMESQLEAVNHDDFLPPPLLSDHHDIEPPPLL